MPSLIALSKDINNDQLLYTIQSKLPRKIIFKVSRAVGDDDWTLQKVWFEIKKYVNILEIGEKHSMPQPVPKTKNTFPFQLHITHHNLLQLMLWLQPVINNSTPQLQTNHAFSLMVLTGLTNALMIQLYLLKKDSRTVLSASALVTKQMHAPNLCFHCMKNANHHCSLCPKLFARNTKQTS